MRYLITGITGMAGSHLAEYLVSQHQAVYGLVRRGTSRLNLQDIEPSVSLIEANFQDYASVREGIQEANPDVIFHLAAQTHVSESWKVHPNTVASNVIPEIHIFESIRELGLDTIVHIASSSEVYGHVQETMNPLDEETPVNPQNPYAVSKWMQERVANHYHRLFGIKTVITRTFNHTGPRRREQFVESNLAKQFVEFQLRLREPKIYIGNLNVSRDFTDVRDIVRAYHQAVNNRLYGETFNVCSGQAVKISAIIDYLSDLTGVYPDVIKDPSRVRSNDTMAVYGNYRKLNDLTGWTPKIPFTKTLADLVTYWHRKLTEQTMEVSQCL